MTLLVIQAFLEIFAVVIGVSYLLLRLESSTRLDRFIKKRKKRTIEKKENEAKKDIPIRQQADPIIAYKRAYVLDTGELAGIGFYDRYRPFSQATCRFGNDHEVPSLTCTCGFWGLTDIKTVMNVNPLEYVALLEVEFFGEVLHMEKGYRAKTQRILSIQFLPICSGCNIRDAEKLISINLIDADASEWTLKNSNFHEDNPSHVAKSIGTNSPLIQFCSVCLEKFKAFPTDILEIREWTLADVANRFQVEANWITEEFENILSRMISIDNFSPHITLFCENPKELVDKLQNRLTITKED